MSLLGRRVHERFQQSRALILDDLKTSERNARAGVPQTTRLIVQQTVALQAWELIASAGIRVLAVSEEIQQRLAPAVDAFPLQTTRVQTQSLWASPIFVLFQSPIFLMAVRNDPEGRAEDHAPIVGFLSGYTRTGIRVLGLTQYRRGLFPIMGTHVVYGDPWRHDRAYNYEADFIPDAPSVEDAITDAETAVRWMLSVNAWIKQDYLVEVPERHSGFHDGGRRWEQTVHTLSLRRRRAVPVGTLDPHPVDWHYQWWVGGHWRQQWMAKTATHEQRWIEAYVKGPEDKPMKPTTTTVYEVKR